MSRSAEKNIVPAASTKQTSPFIKPRSVAAVCIVWKNKAKREVVLIKRRSDHPHQLSGQWFLPGGRVEDEEQPVNAAVRETFEECGIVVVRPSLVDLYAFTETWSDNSLSYSQPIVLAVYQAFYKSGKLAPDECTAVEWIRKRDLKKYLTTTTIRSHFTPVVRKLLGVQ